MNPLLKIIYAINRWLALVSARFIRFYAGLNVLIRKKMNSRRWNISKQFKYELSSSCESSIKPYFGTGYKSCLPAYSLIIKKCRQPMVIYSALKYTIVLNENMVGSAISRGDRYQLNSICIIYISECQNNMSDVGN